MKTVIELSISPTPAPATPSPTIKMASPTPTPALATPTPTPSATPRPVQYSTGCTSDCSGHNAGYAWGEKYDICDTEYSNGNSESFNEGVRQYAEDNCGSDE